MPADITTLQAAFDNITAAAQKTVDTDTSAANLLNSLGQLLREHAGDQAAIIAIADGMSNKAGELSSSADSLAAAITANPVPA